MKKLFLSKFIILLSRLIVVGWVLVIFYFAPQIAREIKYYPNRERACEERADPIRIKINSRSFTIPADYDDNQSLSRCWGFYTAYCTKSQSRKSFPTRGCCMLDFRTS